LRAKSWVTDSKVAAMQEKADKPRRPWWFYVLFGIGALVAGAIVLMIALVMFFMLIYGW
jgi:hypothetical protein